jgi:hypothetical protein
MTWPADADHSLGNRGRIHAAIPIEHDTPPDGAVSSPLLVAGRSLPQAHGDRTR